MKTAQSREIRGEFFTASDGKRGAQFFDGAGRELLYVFGFHS